MKKENNTYKNILVIFMCIIIFFISVFLMNTNRKYTYLENMFKYVNKNINDFFIDNMYITNRVSNNVITAKIKSLERENNNLRKLVSIKEKNINCTNAKIINHKFLLSFFKVDIDAGIKKGVSLKMPVINDEGLVGFISKLGNDVSEVSLLSSIKDNSSLIVQIDNKNDNIKGLLNRYDKKKNLLIVNNVDSKYNIKKGDVVTLSNYMNNDSYTNLYIGKVKYFKESNHGLTKALYVTPGVNFNNIYFVCVVK